MYKSIQVLPRDKMISYAAHAMRPFIIISICSERGTSPEFAENDNLKGVLYLKFDDVEHEPNCISDEQAKQIAEFVEKHEDGGYDLYVHCDAGISRSAGVAAAIMLIKYGHDDVYFDSGYYKPNMKCYRKVLQAYGFDFTPETFELLEKKASEVEKLKKEENKKFLESIKGFKEIHFHDIDEL